MVANQVPRIAGCCFAQIDDLLGLMAHVPFPAAVRASVARLNVTIAVDVRLYPDASAYGYAGMLAY